jgi:hypothetical protein
LVSDCVQVGSHRGLSTSVEGARHDSRLIYHSSPRPSPLGRNDSLETRIIALELRLYSRSEVCTRRGSTRRVRRELRAPHRALVAEEGADPVTSPLPEHRVPIFTSADEQVRSIFKDVGVTEVRHWPGVAWRDKRDAFECRGHRVLCMMMMMLKIKRVVLY